MQIFKSRSDRRRAIAGILGFVVALFLGYQALRIYAPFVFDPTELRIWIGQFGPFAPVVFILIQTLQVIVAPIPGQITALVGGYLFGPYAGTVYSMLGVMVGSAIAFTIASHWGRPAVERLIEESVLNRFDGFVNEVGAPGLLLFVSIPGLPDDAICFLAGLTPIGLPLFLGIMLIGRSPAYIVTNFAGGSIAGGQLIEAVIMLAALVLLSVIAYRKRNQIQQYISG